MIVSIDIHIDPYSLFPVLNQEISCTTYRPFISAKRYKNFLERFRYVFNEVTIKSEVNYHMFIYGFVPYRLNRVHEIIYRNEQPNYHSRRNIVSCVTSS